MSETNIPERRKYRRANFLNTRTHKPVFCIEILHLGIWHRIGNAKKPFEWDDENEREAELKRLRKEASAEHRANKAKLATR